jgi:hypothetical protein
MQAKEKIEQDELQQRASWISWKYGIDEDKILSILSRLNVKVDGALRDGSFRYLSFVPSLEEALEYLRPDIAVRIFESEDLAKIKKLLDGSRALLSKHVNNSHSIEEQCRWETESHFMFND